MYLLVMGFLAAAIWRSRRRLVAADAAPGESPGLQRALGVWIGLIVVGLTVVVLGSFLADRTLAAARDRQALQVRVTGHAWWWRIAYRDPATGAWIETANELHLPAGETTRVELAAADVIHSFWVPRLGPKVDMIPGMHNDLWLEAEEPGIYRGQCAEFCGLQHANMIIRVVADPPADFDRWMAAQAEPAAPSDAAGRQVFETQTCAGCHRVRGTAAQGAVGPDLTHFGGRATLGAGVLPLSPANLRRWISDPQGVKPGVTMPPTTLSADDLDHLVTYLEGLR